MESFSWVSEGPSPLKETQTVKKILLKMIRVPGHHPRALNAKLEKKFSYCPHPQLMGRGMFFSKKQNVQQNCYKKTHFVRGRVVLSDKVA